VEEPEQDCGGEDVAPIVEGPPGVMIAERRWYPRDVSWKVMLPSSRLSLR